MDAGNASKQRLRKASIRMQEICDISSFHVSKIEGRAINHLHPASELLTHGQDCTMKTTCTQDPAALKQRDQKYKSGNADL